MKDYETMNTQFHTDVTPVITQTGIHISHNDADGAGAVVVSNYMLNGITWVNYFNTLGTQDEVVMRYLDKILSTGTIPMCFFITDLGISQETMNRWVAVYEMICDTVGYVFWAGWDHHATNTVTSDIFTVFADKLIPDFSPIESQFKAAKSNTHDINRLYIPFTTNIRSCPSEEYTIQKHTKCYIPVNIPSVKQPVSATYMIYADLVNLLLLGSHVIQTPWDAVGKGKMALPETASRFLRKDATIKDVSKEFVAMVMEISRYDTWTWKTYPMTTALDESSVLTDNTGNIIDYETESIIRKTIANPHEDRWALLTNLYGPHMAFDLFLTAISDHDPSTDINRAFASYNLVKTYLGLKEKEAKAISRMEYNVRFTIIHGIYLTAVLIGDDEYISGYGEHIRDKMPWVDLVMIINPRSWSVSFRSDNTKSIDCGMLAKRYGQYDSHTGGGHPGAAGMRYHKDAAFEYMDDVLRVYFSSTSMNAVSLYNAIRAAVVSSEKDPHNDRYMYIKHDPFDTIEECFDSLENDATAVFYLADIFQSHVSDLADLAYDIVKQYCIYAD